MTNKEALISWCKRLNSMASIDENSVELSLSEVGIDPTSVYDNADGKLMLMCAIGIVRGSVETSKSENGISVSIDVDSINNNIRYWCNRYGIDSNGLTIGKTTIKDISNMW